MRKKAELEHLQEQLQMLCKENENLKRIMVQTLPKPVNIDTLMRADINLPDKVMKKAREMAKQEDAFVGQYNYDPEQKSFCVASTKSPDCPIVYASPGFYTLTGYSAMEVIGRNCRMLQGPETNKNTVSFRVHADIVCC